MSHPVHDELGFVCMQLSVSEMKSRCCLLAVKLNSGRKPPDVEKDVIFLSFLVH